MLNKNSSVLLKCTFLCYLDCDEIWEMHTLRRMNASLAIDHTKISKFYHYFLLKQYEHHRLIRELCVVYTLGPDDTASHGYKGCAYR